MKNVVKCVALVMLAAFVAAANATPIALSIGQAWGVNGDMIQLNPGGEPSDAAQLINAFNGTTTGNLSAIEIVADMGAVKELLAITMQNRSVLSYGVPWDVRVYVAPDENAVGFDYSLASSYTQELTPGARTMLSPASANADVWKSWTLPSSVQRRYVKIDVTGTGFGGITAEKYLAQWQDIGATVVPEPVTVGFMLVGGLFALRRRRN